MIVRTFPNKSSTPAPDAQPNGPVCTRRNPAGALAASITSAASCSSSHYVILSLLAAASISPPKMFSNTAPSGAIHDAPKERPRQNRHAQMHRLWSILPIRAELSGSDHASACGVAVRSGSPVIALCRQLVAASYDPRTPLEAYRGNTLCLHVRSIGEAVGLEIAAHGLGFRKRGRANEDGAPYSDLKRSRVAND